MKACQNSRSYQKIFFFSDQKWRHRGHQSALMTSHDPYIGKNWIFDLVPLLIVVESWSAYQKNRIDPLFRLVAVILTYDAILTVLCRHFRIFIGKIRFGPLSRYFLSKQIAEIRTFLKYANSFFSISSNFFFTIFWKCCGPSNPPPMTILFFNFLSNPTR